MTELEKQTRDIAEQASALKGKMPMHLKVLPEIQTTLALINDMSKVLVAITQNMPTETKGK